MLRERTKSALYRLHGVLPDGSAVIAKRVPSPVAAIEVLVYEEILPRLPIPSPRYHGRADDAGDAGWLFLEDVGSDRYVEADAEHRILAARWLARLHTGVAGLREAERLRQRLPDGGPARYLAHLRAGRAGILGAAAWTSLDDEGRVLFREIASFLSRLEGEWRIVEAACTGLPATLVHGDFRPKNAHVRRTSAGTEIFPMDWETAGWGVPAIDLTRVDAAAYSDAVRSAWPDVRAEAVESLVRLGHLFRFLAAQDWEASRLCVDDAKHLVRPRKGLAILYSGLRDAARRLGWR